MARSKAGFFPVGTLNGCGPAVRHYPLVSGSYYEGNVLRLTGTGGSGKLAEAAGTAVLGVIAADVTTANSTTGKYAVYIADGNTIFQAIGIASRVPQQCVGNYVPLAIGTTFNYRIAVSGASGGATGTKVVRIVGFDPDEALTTHANGKYHVTFTNRTSLFGDANADL